MEKIQIQRKKPKLPIIIAIIILVGLVLIGIIGSKQENQNQENISYSEALKKLNYPAADERIDKIYVFPKSNKVELYDSSREKKYISNIPDADTFLENIKYEYQTSEFELEFVYSEEESLILSLITSLIGLILPIAILSYLLHCLKKVLKDTNFKEKITGEGKILPVETSNYSFTDVAGIDEELSEVVEVVEMLKNPEKYRSTGAKIPKGILLSGEPGTGKTLIAKAIAGEAGVKFYECSGSNFDDTYVGVGASKVRSLFKEARENAPAVIFIDEIDTVAKKRYSNNSYSEQTLNQLLTEMDGFKETENIIFIAATNFIEVLDPAITRPGRFDRIINIPLPDCKGREEILKVHARNKQFANDSEKEKILRELAKKTSGMSGAILENMLNEAAIIAVRNNKTYISEEDIDEAFIKIVVGISKGDKEISDNQKQLVAAHEAGHAIVSRIRRPEVQILQVSIIPRGSAGGYTLFTDKNEDTIVRKNNLLNDIMVSLGGRAAEQITFGDISTGASSDLKKANDIAHKMIYTYAMGENSQLVQIYGEEDYNSQLEEIRFSSMEEIVDKAYEEDLEIVKTHPEMLEELTEALMQKTTLNSSELEEFFSKHNV